MKIEEVQSQIGKAVREFAVKSLGMSASAPEETGRRESEAIEHVCGTAISVGSAKYTDIRDSIIADHKKFMGKIKWELVSNPQVIKLYEENISSHHGNMNWDMTILSEQNPPQIVGAKEINESMTALLECVALEKLFDVLGINLDRTQYYKTLETVEDKLGEFKKMTEQQASLQDLTRSWLKTDRNPQTGSGLRGRAEK